MNNFLLNSIDPGDRLAIRWTVCLPLDSPNMRWTAADFCLKEAKNRVQRMIEEKTAFRWTAPGLPGSTNYIHFTFVLIYLYLQ